MCATNNNVCVHLYDNASHVMLECHLKWYVCSTYLGKCLLLENIHLIFSSGSLDATCDKKHKNVLLSIYFPPIPGGGFLCSDPPQGLFKGFSMRVSLLSF